MYAQRAERDVDLIVTSTHGRTDSTSVIPNIAEHIIVVRLLTRSSLSPAQFTEFDPDFRLASRNAGGGAEMKPEFASWTTVLSDTVGFLAAHELDDHFANPGCEGCHRTFREEVDPKGKGPYRVTEKLTAALALVITYDLTVSSTDTSI